MPIHRFNRKEENDTDDIYTDELSDRLLPKFLIPISSTAPAVAYHLVRDELILDGNSRQNLATFCTTWVEDEIKQLMTDAIDKNMIDKDEYPQTAEIENRCIHMLADLWHADQSTDTVGCSTTGSSEAAMLGGLALKWNWKKRQAAAGKDTSKPNIVTGPVQICWKKFARYFDVELREIPLKGEALHMQPEDIRAYCDENTIAVVPTLGVTFTGVYEPVAEISEELDKIQKETGIDIPIHVDGASGAFIAPFIQAGLVWDFQLKRVKSINASGHKYGLCPLGVGWIVWATREDLPEELIFNVDYLGGNMPTFALNFSRPGGQIIAQYYNFIRFGFEGYRDIHQSCAETAQWLAKELSKINEFDIIYDGNGALPCVAYKLLPGSHGYSLYDLSERVRMTGWQIASYPLPEEREDVVVQRILIRHGVSRDMTSLLLNDIKRCVEYFKENPVNHSSAKPGYHH